jgi:Ser/Thr protein kinase RdoA (MazF antagonist)
MTRTVHLNHGLAADELPPDWPPLTHAEVASVLDRYPAQGAMQEIAWRSPRPLSAAALVRTSRHELFIKRHHVRVRRPGTLAEEHRFAAHLRSAGLPVPAVLADLDGRTVTLLGDWVYEVHEAARGVDAYRDAYSWSPVGGTAQAFVAGAMLGRLQAAARDYRAPQRDTHILVARADILSAPDPLATLSSQLPGRPHLAAYLAHTDWQREVGEAIAPWHSRAAVGLATQPPAWTHGDWHVSNLYWSDTGAHARITDVLDFGLAAQTFALFDLATAIERNAIAWLDIEKGDIGHIDLAAALIAGYDSILPLDAMAREFLADLLPLVHIDFALSEIEYFEGVTRRRDHADVAYRTFLLGHIAWFGTHDGRRFLDAIRYTA